MAVVYDYDTATYKQSDLPADFFRASEPDDIINRTTVRVYDPDDVDQVNDVETGNPIAAQYLGQTNTVSGVGSVCLDSVAVVDRDLSRNPSEVGQPIYSDPLTPGDDGYGAFTRVIATYEKPVTGATCQQVRDQAREVGFGEDYLSEGSFDVISMDPESTYAESWQDVISYYSGIPITGTLYSGGTDLYVAGATSQDDSPGTSKAVTEKGGSTVIYDGEFDESASYSLRSETGVMP